MANNSLVNHILAAEIEYVDVEIETENAVCLDCDCQNGIKKLHDELEACKREVLNKSKHYHETLVENLKKDVTIRMLEKQKKNHIFNEFSNTLSEQTIKEMKSIENVPGKDLAFVEKIMADLYKNDLGRLKTKTISGRTKEPLSPDKVGIIKKVLEKRIHDRPDSIERMKDLGSLVKNAITNIQRKYK